MNINEMLVDWVFDDSERIYMFCRDILNIEPSFKRCKKVQELWNKEYPYVLENYSGDGKSVLAIYAILKVLFGNNEKTFICSPSFYRAKQIFKEVSEIYNNSKMKVPHNDGYGLFRGTDCCGIMMNGNVSSFHSLGSRKTSYERLRGLRGNNIIGDGCQGFNFPVFQDIVSGYIVTHSNPVSA